MPAERYYHPELLEEGNRIHIKDQEHHHLVHVMRTRLGDSIEIVNGNGQLAQAVVDSLQKKSATLLINSIETEQPSKERIILAQGMPRQNRLEFILEKCTELGVTEIWLFPAARSEKKDFSENQLERIHLLTVAAMKQCGRLFLPKIVIMPQLKQWKDIEISPIFFGDTGPHAEPFSVSWQKLGKKNEAIFCIGPESGFAPEEIDYLQQLNALGVKLHPNILRTDTAAIAAITLLSHQMYYP